MNFEDSYEMGIVSQFGAHELKEKGYKIPCLHFYRTKQLPLIETGLFRNPNDELIDANSFDDFIYSAPYEKDLQYYYRYRELNYQGYSQLSCEKWLVVKYTPKGLWLEYGKWISNTSTKKFAYSTKEQALFAYMRRKGSQIDILESCLNLAHEGLDLATEYMDKEGNVRSNVDIEKIEQETFNHHRTKSRGYFDESY